MFPPPQFPRTAGISRVLVFPLLAAVVLLGSLGAIYGPSSLSLSSPQGSTACDHTLSRARVGNGTTVECFLNGTTSITWIPSALTVPYNSTVVIEAGAVGLPHNFALDNVPNDPILANWTAHASTVSPSQLDSYFANHTLVGLSVNAGGTNRSAPTELPSGAGTYYFVCLVPGHFQAGMWGTLTEGNVAPSGSSGAPSLTASYLLFGVILAVLVAVAVIFLLTRKRPPHSTSPPPTSGNSENVQ